MEAAAEAQQQQEKERQDMMAAALAERQQLLQLQQKQQRHIENLKTEVSRVKTVVAAATAQHRRISRHKWRLNSRRRRWQGSLQKSWSAQRRRWMWKITIDGRNGTTLSDNGPLNSHGITTVNIVARKVVA